MGMQPTGISHSKEPPENGPELRNQSPILCFAAEGRVCAAGEQNILKMSKRRNYWFFPLDIFIPL
jgi:hypothetical protein